MKTKPLFLALVALLLSLAGAAQKDSIRFAMNPRFDSILAVAHNEHKIVFMDTYTSWCIWCKRMDKYMFIEPTVAAYYNSHFICIKMDMEKGQGPALGKKYKIASYPTYLFLSDDSAVVSLHEGAFLVPDTTHKAGYTPLVEDFIAFGEKSIADAASYPAYHQEFMSGAMSQQRLLAYIKLLSGSKQNCDAQVDAFIANQKDPSDSLSWQVIRQFAGVHTNAFQSVIAHRKMFYGKYTADTVDMVFQQKYQIALYRSLGNPIDTALYARLREQVVALDAEFSERLPMETDLALYYVTGNWTSYAALADTYVAYYADTNWLALNNMSWNFYEHVDDPEQLAIAAGWAKHSIEINENYFNVDTYACLLSKMGKKHQAIKAAKRAIELAKEFNATHDPKAFGSIDYSADTELIDKLKGRKT
jgi:thiol-disulfide isomerase/thioredoxin